jgi:hypothetical protein
MLEAIRADEVELEGRALAVRYKEEPGQPGWMVVNITAHATEGGPDFIRRCELALVVVGQRMSQEAMRTRVQAEAQWRAIRRVAWVRES